MQTRAIELYQYKTKAWFRKKERKPARNRQGNRVGLFYIPGPTRGGER